MSIKLLMADEYKIFREGLLLLLGKEPGVDVIGDAGDGETAVRLAMELNPDLVIMNVSMHGMDGIEATRLIKKSSSGMRVIALSESSTRKSVTDMLHAGASGYLVKDCSFSELMRAIQAVYSGEMYLSQEVAGVVIEDYLNKINNKNSSESKSLTNRETEVLQYISSGMRTREIADKLEVSIKTIETHRRQIMEKLKMYSIAELTKYSIKEGLTTI
jgi:DNA-binding NarL/FixJ family response regulator